MSRRSLPKATSIPLLSDAIAVSYASGTTLPIVAETRSVDASITLAMSVPVISINFAQIEGYIVVLA